jgi:lysophospholipase L1-like esterase
LFYDPKLTPPAAPLHPTAEGQALMAAAIEPTLAALLGDRPHIATR